MSTSHHSSPEEQAARDRMLEEFLHTAKPQFPRGKRYATDEGELSFAVAVDTNNNTIIIRYAKPVDWVGFSPKEARYLANLLLEKAAQLTEEQLDKP